MGISRRSSVALQLRAEGVGATAMAADVQRTVSSQRRGGIDHRFAIRAANMAYNAYVLRTLLVMRHGKSSWDDYETDFERPLAKRGLKAARFMGGLLLAQELIPDAIVSSPAERALSTAELVAGKLEIDEIFQNRQMYGVGCRELVDVVARLDDSWQTVLLVGHNPGFEELVDELTGGRDTIMKTASLAVLTCNAESWSSARRFELLQIFHPRELMEED